MKAGKATMHISNLFLIIRIVNSFVLPKAERSDTLLTAWLPIQVSRLDAIDNGFSNIIIHCNNIADKADVELRNQTSRLSLRDEEVTAPPSTVWQPLPDSQWDDWHRDVVVKAWQNALDLAQAAANSLTEIMDGSPKYAAFWESTKPECKTLKKDPTKLTAASQNKLLLCYRHFIAAHNLAYGQYFGADPENIGLIRDNFLTIVSQTNNIDADNREKQILYLTWGPTITDMNRKKNECAEENGALPQAMIIPANAVQELAESSVSQDAQVLHFCPAFFDVKQLGRLELQTASLIGASNAKKAEICVLSKLDSTTRALLHEFTHLHWTLNTNAQDSKGDSVPADTYGWFNNIDASVDTRQRATAQQPHTIRFSSKNADNYAWMAIYNYFNSLDKCAGIKYTGVNQAPSTCNTDVWPQGVDKPVKTEWKSYPGAN